MVLQEIKRSGYDGLLPAGMVLTGGSSNLPGIKEQASKIMGMPVRISQPDKLTGMADNLQSPAFSTSVGLLRWALLMSEVIPHKDKYSFRERNYGQNITLEKIMSWLRRLLP